MYLKIFYGLLAVLLTSVGTGSITSAQSDAPSGPKPSKEHLEHLQEEFERLQKQQTQALDQWRQSGQDHLPSLQSPLVSSDDLADRLPPECVAHLEEEKTKLEQRVYSKQEWLHHVFECERCCAPLLDNVMDMHVAHVIANPHMVVLFDFDTNTIKPSYQQRLDTFMSQVDVKHDQLLLIGRASRVGHKAYNIILSGRRAAEIQDYVLAKFGVADDQLRYLFFGADPPQLTLDNAAEYGITAEEIAALDTNRRNRAENKVNQSVVVIINQHSDDVAKPHTTSPQIAHVEPHEARKAPQVQAVSEDVKSPQADTLSVSEATRSSGRDREASSPRSPDRLIMVTEAPTSTSFHFGRDMMRVGRDVGLDMVLQQSESGIHTIKRLLNSQKPAVGMVPSDMPGVMSQSPDAEMNRLAEQLHLLFPLYSEEVHLLAHKDIQRVEDLDGKRVIVGVQGSRTWLTASHLLRKLKVHPDPMINADSPLKAIVKVLQGRADAMFYVGEKPALPFISMHNLLGDARYASLLQDVHFVPLNSEPAGPEYTASALGPQDYTWVKTAVPTLAVQMGLASFDDSRPASHQDDRHCGQLVALTQAVRDNFAALQRSGHVKWQDVDLDHRLTAWQYHSCTQSETTR